MQYAGMYVPYIANYLYENPDELDLELKGIWIANRMFPLPFQHHNEHSCLSNPSYPQLGCCPNGNPGRRLRSPL